MGLAPGARIGTYEIVGAIGAGAMGEVYRARDSRLGRDVAIKVLPAAFTSDADRLARFEREARVLASLNHPNVASIYGLEESAGIRALVLELVEGETLADLLHARGRLGVDETLAIARQIAAALDAAHERGIVHRDLKPANIKITPDGVVKVLDFGLAKALQAIAGGSDLSQTLSETREGVILGTAAYLSPEQARGQAVDKRTDIWSFGCVVYETLTGRAPFQAETLSDTIVKILGTEPDWAALLPSTPARVVRLLQRCLDRDVKHRLRDLGDVDLALDAGAATSSKPERPAWFLWAAAIAGAALLTAGAMLVIARLRDAPVANAAPVRFEVPIPVRLAEAGSFALSPDGRRIAFVATGADGIMRIWLRSFDTLETRPLRGTESEVGRNTTMFWSPDSRFIAFYANGTIKKVDAAGGVPHEICKVPAVAVGGSWNREDVVVVGSVEGGLLQCRASGGTGSRVTNAGTGGPGGFHLFPWFLPDGRHLLYLHVSRQNPSKNGLYIADLTRMPEQQRADRVLETGFNGEYVVGPDGSGRILFVRDKALWAVPFDVRRLATTGEAVPVAAPVGSFLDGAFFRATKDVLVYRGEVPDVQLAWRNRKGTDLGVAGPPGQYSAVALSPDGARAVVLRANRIDRSDHDLWLVDLARNTTTRFTTDPSPESAPAWSADGRAVLFAVGHDRVEIRAKPVDGSPARVLLAPATNDRFRLNAILTFISSTVDGRHLLFTAEGLTGSGSDIWLLPLQQNARPVALLPHEFDQQYPSISPGGRWLAYASNEAGATEVFVRPLTPHADTGLPAVGAPTLVSRGGGTAPRWSADGQELFYQSAAGTVMSARIASNGVDAPAELFRAPGMLANWGVAPDGRKFLLALPVSQDAQAPFTVVLNWQAGLSAPGR